LGAIGGGDVAVTGAPEAERVDERLADDHLGAEACVVPDASVRAGEVEVCWLTGPRVPVELAPVHLHYRPRTAGDRDHHAAVEVLVAGLPEHPEALQPAPGIGAGLGLAVGQAVTEGAVSVAETEDVDGLGVVNAPRAEITERIRGTEQGRVVVLDDLGESLGVAGVALDRGRQAADSGACGDRPAECPAP
jgi:hypothetical protein